MIRNYIIIKRVLRIENASVVNIFTAIHSGQGFKRITNLSLYQSAGEGVSDKEEPFLAEDDFIAINRSGIDIRLIRQ